MKRQKQLWYIVYLKLKKWGLLRDDEVMRKFQKLQVASQEQAREQLLSYRKRQISIFFIGLAVLLGVASISVIKDRKKQTDTITIERNPYGDGDKTEHVYADGEEIEFSVGEQKYKEEEVEQKFQEAFSYAQKQLLGQNKSYDYVTSDLNFFEEIPDSAIQVSWVPDDYELIDSSGRVQNESLDNTQKKGVITSVTGTFSYGDIQYEREYPLCIYEREVTSEESKKKQY